MSRSSGIRLIVNADDFGYFDEVSRGIIHAAQCGTVTATGVMANGPALARWLDNLKALRPFSVGVHLNASLGIPLTVEMQRELPASDGRFPSKGALLSALLLQRIDVNILLQEWRAQIQRCLDLGLTLQFVNSHEHVHMLPGLYSRVRSLAAEFGIVHVRGPRPEWGPVITLAGCVRSGAFATIRTLAGKPPGAEPDLIGIATSGKLDRAYLEWRLPRLSAGGYYELMCHPGWNDPEALRNPRLAAYHDWEGELRLLTSSDFATLMRSHQIELSTFTT